MASMELITFLLTDRLACKLFKAIVEKTSLLRRELVEMGQPATADEVYTKLDKLTQHGVIAVDTVAPIEDFWVYYVTSAGLTAHRDLNRIAASTTDMRIGF